MTKQPARDHISGTIDHVEFVVKNGVLKPHRRKGKSKMTQNVTDEVAGLVNDMVPPIERDKINKKVRSDWNPASGAHNIVADTKRKLSKQAREDLGLN